MNKKLSNRLFSSFLEEWQVNKVNFAGYFPIICHEGLVNTLPSDHSLYYPITFEEDGNKLVKGESNFYTKVLLENYITDNHFDDAKTQYDFRDNASKSALVVNLCDNCYGHSFLKLLNLYNIYKLYAQSFEIVVITPIALAHFVPQEKFSIITLRLGFNEAMKCPSFKHILDRVKGRYQHYDFVTLDTYSLFDEREALVDFFPFYNKNGRGTNQYFTFYYRSDFFRSWGGSKQANNFTQTMELLRPFFKGVKFIVIGDKDSYVFPSWIIDKRTSTFGKEVDLEFNDIFKDSCAVVGLIGSNMLQPSILCDFTIHLTPKPKVTIVAEEFLNSNGSSISQWFNNIYITGDDDLSSLTPIEVSEQIVLLYQTYLAKRYKEVIFSDKYFNSRVSQKEFINMKYTFFDAELAYNKKVEITQRAFKRSLRKYRIKNLLLKFKIKR